MLVTNVPSHDILTYSVKSLLWRAHTHMPTIIYRVLENNNKHRSEEKTIE